MTLLTACTCPPTRLVADAVTRTDPTGTGAIRRRYEREMLRRFRRLKRLIQQAVVDLDVLGLTGGDPQKALNAALFSRTFGTTPQFAAPHDSLVADAEPPPARAFAFQRSGDKVGSFMDWLYSAEQNEILGVTPGTGLRSASRSAWQNLYIDSAYQKGIRDATARSGLGGEFARGAFNRPVHADAVGIAYTRAYRDLEGVNDEMDKAISRTLARGLAEGRGARAIARSLLDEVDGIGITRARTLARTEIINAYAEASLNLYEEAGLEGVDVEAEIATADDDAVCEECETLSENGPYSIDDARGMVPVHPNCRCAFVPVVDGRERDEE